MRLTLAELLPGTQYVVQVRANNGTALSQWSPAFDLLTDEDTTAPKIPTNTTWVVVGDAFYAEWDSMGENVNNDYANIIRYEIEFIGNSITKIVSVPQITESRNNYTLSFEENKSLFGTAAASVRFRVRSVDIKDLKSAWSTPITVTNASPNAPASANTNSGSGNIQVSWTASTSDDVVSYNVYNGTTAGFTPSAGNRIFSGNTLTFIFTTSSTVTQYFKIRSVDKFGQESTDTSTSGTATTPFEVDSTPPIVPTSLAGTITNNADGLGARASLTWSMGSPPSDLAGFYVRYRRVGDTNYSNITFQKDDRAGIVELQKAYQNYEFQIKAFDWQNNESAWSATVTVTSPSNAAPSNVTGLTSVAGKDSITYQWTPVSDTDIKNYEVTFSTSSTFASDNTTYFTGQSAFLTVSGLAQNFFYYARVRAVDNQGLTSAAWSSTNTNSTGSYPATPLSDGYPPGSSPTPNVQSGLGYLYATWTAVATNSIGGVQRDPVTYEVHLSITNGFTPSGSTKVTEVSGTFAVIDVLPGTTTPLAYGTTYYIKLIAKDRDGAAAAGSQGSGQTAQTTSSDITSVNADLIVAGSGIINTLIINTGGAIQSANYVAGSAGWKISPTGAEFLDSGSTIKADAIKAGTLGGSGGSGVINIAAGSSLVLNGGYIKSNTYTGTSYNASATAGFYLGNDGLRIAQGAVSAATLTTGDVSAASITLSSTGEIKSNGYVDGVSSAGFRLSSSGLQIPDGTISAAKLQIQRGAANLVPGEYSSFELPSTFYTMSENGPATGVWSISNTRAWQGTQSLKVVATHTATSDNYTEWSGSGTYAIQPGKTYIVSTYIYQEVGNSADTIPNLIIDGSANGGTYRAPTAGSWSFVVANAWTRVWWYFTAGANETSVKIYPRITPATVGVRSNRVYYFDAIQLEEQQSSLTTPSGYSLNGVTQIDGGMIKTGSIQSTSNLTINGQTLPTWIINTAGSAQFGNLWVRGTMVVGQASEDTGTSTPAQAGSSIASYNYTPGSSGWGIMSNGTAEFFNIKARGDIEATTIKSGTIVSGTIIAQGAGGIHAYGVRGEDVGMTGAGFQVLGAYEISVSTVASTTTDVVTFTTDGVHGFTTGNSVIISGTTTWDGTYTIASTPSTSTFTVAFTTATFSATSVKGLAQSMSTGTSASSRPLLIDFPTDGSKPNIVSGKLSASTLSVSTAASLQGTTTVENGTINISKGVTDPTIAPSLAVTWDVLSSSYISTIPDGAQERSGLTIGPDGHYWFTEIVNKVLTAIKIHNTTGAVLDTRTIATLTEFYGRTWNSLGIVYNPTSSRFHVGHQVISGSNYIFRVKTYDTSWNFIGNNDFSLGTVSIQQSASSPPGPPYITQYLYPTIGWDYTNNNLVLAYYFGGFTTGQQYRHVPFTMTSGSPTAMGTNSYFGGTDIYTPKEIIHFSRTNTIDNGVLDLLHLGFADGQYIVFDNTLFREDGYEWSSPTGTLALWGAAYNTTKKQIFGLIDTGIVEYATGEYVWWDTKNAKNKSVHYTWFDSTASKTANITSASATSTTATIQLAAGHGLVAGDVTVGTNIYVTTNYTSVASAKRYNGLAKITAANLGSTPATITYDRSGSVVGALATTGTVQFGVNETKVSPIATIATPKRSRIKVTVPPIPYATSGIVPDKAKIYITGLSSTAWSTTINYPGVSATVPDSSQSPAFPNPTYNSFADVNFPAEIKSGATDVSGAMISLKGDGSGRVGPLSWSNTGKTLTAPGTPTTSNPYSGYYTPRLTNLPNNSGWYRTHTGPEVTIPSGARLALVTMEVAAYSVANNLTSWAFQINKGTSGTETYWGIASLASHNDNEVTKNIGATCTALIDLTSHIANGRPLTWYVDGNNASGSGNWTNVGWLHVSVTWMS